MSLKVEHQTSQAQAEEMRAREDREILQRQEDQRPRLPSLQIDEGERQRFIEAEWQIGKNIQEIREARNPTILPKKQEQQSRMQIVEPIPGVQKFAFSPYELAEPSPSGMDLWLPKDPGSPIKDKTVEGAKEKFLALFNRFKGFFSNKKS